MTEHYDSDPETGCGMMIVMIALGAIIVWVLAVYGAAHMLGWVR